MMYFLLDIFKQISLLSKGKFQKFSKNRRKLYIKMLNCSTFDWPCLVILGLSGPESNCTESLVPFLHHPKNQKNTAVFFVIHRMA